MSIDDVIIMYKYYVFLIIDNISINFDSYLSEC